MTTHHLALVDSVCFLSSPSRLIGVDIDTSVDIAVLHVLHILVRRRKLEPVKRRRQSGGVCQVRMEDGWMDRFIPVIAGIVLRPEIE